VGLKESTVIPTTFTTESQTTTTVPSVSTVIAVTTAPATVTTGILSLFCRMDCIFLTTEIKLLAVLS